MFFYASKIISAVIWPSNFITLMLLAGLGLMVSGWAVVWGRRMLVSAVGLHVLLGFFPVGNWMILPLEERFARAALPDKIAGIIILGGFESPAVGKARGELAVNEAAERLIESILVAKARPDARVVFTGGDGSLLWPGVSAAAPIGAYLQAMGIAPERIVLESVSRTTHENALYLQQMLSPKAGERWLLVTSAFHMPRSMGTFRRQGFDVIAWPVDYRTRGGEDRWSVFSSPPAGLERVDVAFKEWVGLVAYRLSGRTTAFWPGAEIAPPVSAQPGAPGGVQTGAPGAVRATGGVLLPQR